MNLEQIIEQIKAISIQYGPKLIGAIIIWIIGIWVIKLLSNGIENILDKKEIDPSLKPFLKGLFSVLLKVLLFISILSTLGI
ncbi:MAG: mechanosensitive ion channel family protein, partial [Aureibaculum sp.]